MMLAPLADRTFARLFAAQVVALIGTGLATVALGLLAYDLAGAQAGLVLGTALTLKMVAYVLVSPVAGALAERLPRRTMLVALDAARAVVALLLPFVTEIWQVFALILMLQTASAAFTPVFQATIPDVLPDEERYTRALSLSRLAFDLESLTSPVLAALLLLFVPFNALFGGTALGFIVSGCLLLSITLPNPDRATDPRRFRERVTRGLRIYLATPRLRGLFSLGLAAALTGSMVLVNTVVLVREDLGRAEVSVALALGAFGAGSMGAALVLPRLLERWRDRAVMCVGATCMVMSMATLAAVTASDGLSWSAMLVVWALSGAGYASVMTPSGRLLRRSAHAADRPAIFAAQFALSHAGWLLAYPLAGILMTWIGAAGTMATLSILAAAAALWGGKVWPAADPDVLEHGHPELPPDHPHLAGAGPHRHAVIIDDLHRRWPT